MVRIEAVLLLDLWEFSTRFLARRRLLDGLNGQVPFRFFSDA